VTTPVTKHIPVYVEPEQDYSPQPTIPDDLRNDSLSKDFVAMVTVSSDGTIKDLKVTQSTGIKELDDVATSTLKTWRFKPATLDGSGTDGAVKLTIQFRVE
jgi:protein TonB